MATATNCPCGSGRALADCCGPHIDGTTPAPTAEALMRSRYSAYATGAIDYIQATLSAESKGRFDYEGAQHWSKNSTWNGLEIHATEAGGESDDTGIVEFTASFETAGTPQQHREVARFIREDGLWVYEDGDMVGTTFRRETPKVGRNEPCPCGSGKKFKHCHGALV